MIRLDISKNTRIIADNARPEIIAELRKVFNMKPSTKGPNSIYYGILKILEFELYITRNSHNVIREIGSYRYKEDKDGNFSNEVVEVDDHSMDALRYVVRDLVDGDKGVLAFG
jgi:phage terminase large subunit